MLTLHEAAKQLQHYELDNHPFTIRRWIKEGALIAVRQNGTKGDWLIPENSLSQLIISQLTEEKGRLQQQCDALQIEQMKLEKLLEDRALKVHQPSSEKQEQQAKLDLKEDMPF